MVESASPPPSPSLRPTPTPEVENNDDFDNNSVSSARLQAEVNVLQEGNASTSRRGGGRQRDNTLTDEAMMGAAPDGVGGYEVTDENGEEVFGRFLLFLHEFSEYVVTDEEDEDDKNNNESRQFFPYLSQRDALASSLLQGSTSSTNASQLFSSTLFVSHSHLREYDSELGEAVQNEYVRFEPFLKKSLRHFLTESHPSLHSLERGLSKLQLAFWDLPSTLPVRMALKTDQIGRLTSMTGTVTRTSDVRPELLSGSFRCTKCGLLHPDIQQQFHFSRPKLCRNPGCRNSSPGDFLLDFHLSDFCDWQKLRVQENPDEIPPGSMPRCLEVVVRGEMVERAKAGDLCEFVGMVVVIPDGSALSRAGEVVRSSVRGEVGEGVKGLKETGCRELTYRLCFVASSVRVGGICKNMKKGTLDVHELFAGEERTRTAEEVAMSLTREERDEIRKMKNERNLYAAMVNSIAPTTFGHLEIKRGILLMLLGGVHKTTPEGINLRGDINVCIVGDPSTAKSQFLKYVHSFLPSKSVYTSGKTSSAAGLTASIQRDADTGEFCIEAGALMLADNGICCIDEFDKMDISDQVAIHEAMEQQTISITKAGIQATLNARASILAAANPIYGRYDKSKTLKANVALSAPILSRFDLFFVVLDDCDELADYNVAKHILDVHRCDETNVTPPFTKDQMRRYITFAKTLSPTITPESQQVMVDCYRKLRQGDTLGRSRTAYRITVRQLESMIRLSEALAKLHCDDVVKPSYVREAFRLLKKSIIHVESEDVTFEEDEDAGDLENDDHDDNMETARVPVAPSAANAEEDRATTTSAANEPHQNVPPTDNTVQTQQPPQTTITKKKRKKKKKTQITFEQYETISNAIATYLRANESSSSTKTWSQVREWYLEQCEDQIGDSVEELDRLVKLTNLVIKRLVTVDHVLVFTDEDDGGENDNRSIAVHPNYVIS